MCILNWERDNIVLLLIIIKISIMDKWIIMMDKRNKTNIMVYVSDNKMIILWGFVVD